MNRQRFFIIVWVAGALIVAYAAGLFGKWSTTPVKKASTVVAWSLEDGKSYTVADFYACSRDGMTFTEWHFGGKDRSVQNHQTPLTDRFGQRWFEVVTWDKSLPPGHMRVVKVLDPGYT